jgi:translation initiation factor 1 (eIF-1/SUI1)
MVYIWLDRDKAKNAIRIKNRLKGLGLKSKVIVTDLDPKEYTTKEIEQWLKNR